MSKYGLQYREETGYDVGVYCEDSDNEQSIWYFHEHYVHWLEQKIEALSQHDVIKNEVAVCEHSETENLYCDVGWAIEGKRCKKCKQTVL
jgi:hypothetical protein